LSGDRNDIFTTIIDGNAAGSVVTFESNEHPCTRLIGLTLTNGGSDGAGIMIRDANPVIEYCRLVENDGIDGGGVHVLRANPVFDHCEIAFNNALRGGGMSLILADVEIINCTIFGNSTSNTGGGIHMKRASNIDMVNTILRDNKAQQVYFLPTLESNSMSVRYSNVAGGEEAIVHNDNGTVDWGEGCGSFKPGFVDQDNGDFTLSWRNFPKVDRTKSWSIDSGDPDISDPDGTVSDMGAWYFDQGEVVDGEDMIALANDLTPETFNIASTYPNPFNSTTSISYGVPFTTHVVLALYDLRGRRIATLADGYQNAGYHTATLSGHELATGTYLLKLNGAGSAAVSLVTLVK
jgi:hypothetical protein